MKIEFFKQAKYRITQAALAASSKAITQVGLALALIILFALASTAFRLATAQAAASVGSPYSSPALAFCSYHVSPMQIGFEGKFSYDFEIHVVTDAGCPWTTVSNANWIKVKSGAFQTGSGKATLFVDVNPSQTARNSTVSIAGKLVTVTQSGKPCATITISPATLSGGMVGQPYSQTLTATGGVAPYSYQPASGSVLPQGLSLLSGKLIGIPQIPTLGQSFTVVATDAQGCQGSLSYVIRIAPAACPTITVSGFSNYKDNVGANFSQSYSASGGQAPYSFSVSAGSLPPGLSLNGNMLSGSLTTAGVYNFTIKATDANGCTGTKASTVTVNLNICPTITVNPVVMPDIELSKAFTQSLSASGGTAPYEFSLSAGALPPGVQLSGSNLSGTPTTLGNYNFTIKTTDAKGCTGTHAYVLKVQVGCPSIAVGPASVPAATVGTAIQPVNFTANNAQVGYGFSLSAGALPPGLQLNGNNVLSGTPTTVGTYNFSIKATDSKNCTGTHAYTLTVNSKACATITVNQAGLPAGMVNTAFAQNFSASGGAAPYQFSVSAGDLPTGLSLSPNGVLTGTPSEPGAASFTIKALDANGCQGTRLYSLTIAPAPLASVSAASYLPGAAPESIVAAFGVKLAADTQVASTQPLPVMLAKAVVSIEDSFGMSRSAPLFFVSPGQINYQVPPGTALGTATVKVLLDNALIAAGTLEITMVSPGLFTASATGQGPAAALALRVKGDGSQSYEPVAQYKNNQFVTMPIDLGPQSDQVFLVLYGTGLRYRQNLSVVVTTLGGNVSGDVLYVGAAPGFVGLDQVNVRIPRSLIGRSEIDLALMAEGKAANVVRVNVQ